MKICDACGERNWADKLNPKKVIVCGACGRPMLEAVSNPERAVRDGNGNMHTTRKKISDEQI